MRLFVGNLAFQTTEQTIKDAFARIGTVTDCALMTDRATQRSRGFAFVTMGSTQEGETAIRELNGKELDGRTINVSQAKPREESGRREDRPRGGGGGERW